MAYSYNRLWKLMIDKKINKTTLRREAGITSNAMAKLGKDQPVKGIRVGDVDKPMIECEVFQKEYRDDQ